MAETNPYRVEDAAQLNRQTGPRVDTGYAVNIPNVDPNERNNWTVQLIKPNRKYLNLWVEEMSIDFSISGSTGQSRWKREFFPRSFNQPTLMMTGFMPNPREYNKLAAFVRESHSEALNINRNYSETSGGNTNTYKNSSIPLPTVTLLTNPRKTFGRSRNQKGGRRGMKLEGYIGSINAGAERHQQAPQFQIEFIIASSDGSVGIYDDRLDAGSKITDWMRLFQKDFLGAQRGDQIRNTIDLENKYLPSATFDLSGAPMDYNGLTNRLGSNEEKIILNNLENQFKTAEALANAGFTNSNPITGQTLPPSP